MAYDVIDHADEGVGADEDESNAIINNSNDNTSDDNYNVKNL